MGAPSPDVELMLAVGDDDAEDADAMLCESAAPCQASHGQPRPQHWISMNHSTPWRQHHTVDSIQ